MLQYDVDYKVEGYRNRWSVIDDDGEYALLENATWGDETCYLVVRMDVPVQEISYKKKDGSDVLIPTIMKVEGETYDDLQTALEDEGIL